MLVIKYIISLSTSTSTWRFQPSCHSAQHQLLAPKQFNQALWSRHGFLAWTPLTIRPLIASVFHRVSQQRSFVITTRWSEHSGGSERFSKDTETLSADVCVSGSEDGSVGDRKMNCWPWAKSWNWGGGYFTPSVREKHTFESIVLAMNMIQLARPSTYPFLEWMLMKSLERAELWLNT